MGNLIDNGTVSLPQVVGTEPSPVYIPTKSAVPVARKIESTSEGNKQKFNKDSKPPNIASKRKSFAEEYEESDVNFLRRKTFVVKSSNVLAESESILHLNKIDKDFYAESNDKTVFHQNEDTAEYQIPFPECAVNFELVENCENSNQSENIKLSSKLYPSETLTGFEAICAENSKQNEHNVEVSSLHMNMISGIPSKELIVPDQIVPEGVDSTSEVPHPAYGLKIGSYDNCPTRTYLHYEERKGHKCRLILRTRKLGNKAYEYNITRHIFKAKLSTRQEKERNKDPAAFQYPLYVVYRHKRKKFYSLT